MSGVDDRGVSSSCLLGSSVSQCYFRGVLTLMKPWRGLPIGMSIFWRDSYGDDDDFADLMAIVDRGTQGAPVVFSVEVRRSRS